MKPENSYSGAPAPGVAAEPVCSLDESSFESRAASWAALADKVRTKKRTGNGFRVEYDPSASGELRDLVEAERACCSWATWTFRIEADGATLEVTGPPEPLGAPASAFGV